MEHIVKSETAPTMAQARVTASVLVSMIVVLAALGMFAAAQAGSTASVVLAVVFALPAPTTARALFSLPGTAACHHRGRAWARAPAPARELQRDQWSRFSHTRTRFGRAQIQPRRTRPRRA